MCVSEYFYFGDDDDGCCDEDNKLLCKWFLIHRNLYSYFYVTDEILCVGVKIVDCLHSWQLRITQHLNIVVKLARSCQNKNQEDLKFQNWERNSSIKFERLTLNMKN